MTAGRIVNKQRYETKGAVPLFKQREHKSNCVIERILVAEDGMSRKTKCLLICRVTYRHQGGESMGGCGAPRLG